jgi:hypothetical protein
MALCAGFFVSRKSIESLISLHQDNLGRAALALNYWATSGAIAATTEQSSSDPQATSLAKSKDDDDWEKIEQVLLGSGKRPLASNEVRPMAVSPFPNLDVDDVEIIFENGFVDLIDSNLMELLPLYKNIPGVNFL